MIESSEHPPESIVKALGDENLPSEPRLTATADILPDGRFGESWIIVSDDHLYVVAQEEALETPHPSTEESDKRNALKLKAQKRHLSLRPKSKTDSPTASPLPSGEEAAILKEFALENASEANIEQLVGASALTLTIDGKPQEVVRFTSGKAQQFSHLQRSINALLKEEELPPAPEKDTHCPKCGRPYVEDSQICRVCAPKGQALRRIFGFAAPYKHLLVLSGLIILASTIISLAPPILNKMLFDNVLVPQGAPLPRSEALRMLGWLVGGLILIKMTNTGLQIARGMLNSWIGNRVAYDLRTRLFFHLQWLSLSYYDKRNSGAIMSRMTQDTGGVYDLLAESAPVLIVNTFQLVGIALVLLYFNWQLALMILLPAPIIFMLIKATRKRLMGLWRNYWHRWSRLSGALAGTFSGMRVVKAFAQEDYEIKRFNRRINELLESNLQAEQSWAVLFPIIGFLIGSGEFLVWYFGGRQVLTNSMTIGELVLFGQYLTMFYSPLQVLTRVIDWLTRSVTAAERIFEVLDTEPEVKEASNAIPMPTMKGEVEFQNVSFAYQPGNDVLKEINLKVKAGEMIGLVGHSGAGKSTLINLLSRFYDPTDGSILVDGVPMNEIKLTDLRRHIGVVLQDSFLFPGSIKDNIAYAKHDATMEEILAAAKAANAHDFIMRFPDGYDTFVGERGQRLSGGERQRIAIARAILHDPRILILDEATASVDTETERQIQEALARLIENRTTFAIAHRLSTLRNADRLIVIDHGKIAEEGTHDELIDKEDGIYAKLVNMQTELNKIVALAE